MDCLSKQIEKAKRELQNQIQYVHEPGTEIEFSEIKELEKKLQFYILQGEKILKQYFKDKKQQ